MALSLTTLARELLKLVERSREMPRDGREAGRRWARAYAEYAKAAQSPTSAPPAPLTIQEQVLAAAMGVTFVSSIVSPQSATQIANALTSFWLLPPVVFGPGLVTAVGGTALLTAALQSVWLGNQASGLPPGAATRNIATAIDAFTRTVIVTSPGPVVGPIF